MAHRVRNRKKEREEKDKSRKAVHVAFYVIHSIAVVCIKYT